MAVRTRTKLTPKQVQNLVKKLPGILAGTEPDRYGIRPTFAGTVARVLFDKIYKAYLTKSRGGTDDLGERWPDLATTTKMARLSRPEVKKKLGFGNRVRGLLTLSQDQTWRQVYAEVLSNLMRQGLDYGVSRDIAAGAAWNHVKALGASTRQSVAQTASTGIFPIMIDTGRLVASLAPRKGMGARYRAGKDQLYKQTPGNIQIGTTVPYAEDASEGDRKPLRRLWSPNIDPWVEEAVAEGCKAVEGKIQDFLS